MQKLRMASDWDWDYHEWLVQLINHQHCNLGCFSRAPGFMDVVCYTGTGSATTFAHNLGVVPELMIVKRRSLTLQDELGLFMLVTTQISCLNTTAATADDNTYWNDTSPTASVFYCWY
jgi:hypothetical protein